MTVQALPWAIQGQTHTAEVARNLTAAMFAAPVATLVEGISITTAGGAHGVVGATDLAVTQNGTPDRNVIVAAGRAIIRSTEASSLLAGAYSWLNDAALLALTAASDPTNPRIDLVIAQVRDSNYSGASTDSRVAVVTGTPNASPVTPTVPDSCVVLAQVAVAAASTTVVNANITDKRTRAYALGGIATCTSTTRPSGVSLYEGLTICELDTDRMWVYSGAAWVFLGYYSVAGRPGVILTDAAQTVNAATVTDITWGTEITDVDGWTAGGIATLTVPTGWDGRYAISYTATANLALSGNTSAALNVGGVVVAAVPMDLVQNAVALHVTRSFAAAETLKISLTHNSGAARDFVSRLEVVWLGR